MREAELYTLPVARYRFICELDDELRLPEYAGSLLRGAFGASLRRTVCMTKLAACTECPLRLTCPYPAIFETPARPTRFSQRFSALPNPYVIEPPALGTRRAGTDAPLVFNMVLIGAATLRQLPLIVHAWQRALRHGLGSWRVSGHVRSVHLVNDAEPDEEVLDAATGQILPHAAHLKMNLAPEAASRVVLHWQTPLRLQHQGAALGADALTPRTLVAALLRRTALLFEVHGDKGAPLAEIGAVLTSATELTDERSQLRWTDWTRYSARQRQEMTLGGVTGPWTLAGELRPVLPWLRLGQWLHVGKNATMGMGRYHLEVM